MQYGSSSSYGGDELAGSGLPVLLDVIAGVFTIFTAACAVLTGARIVSATVVQTIQQVDASVLTDLKIED